MSENPNKEVSMNKVNPASADVVRATDRYVRLLSEGGSPTLELRPTELPEFKADDGEVFPPEEMVKITFPRGTMGEFRPEAIRAALNAVEEIRRDA